MGDKPYRPVLGSVMWGQLATCPDLSFAVSLLSRFQANPGIDHWKSLLHVIGYIKNTMDYGLTYSRDADLTPVAYVDADYGGCRDTRHSTLGYVFMMAGGAVTWSSKQQPTVTLSTVEAEYVAMSWCTQQMIWMQTWLDEVEIIYTTPGIIRGDSRGAIALAKTTKDHGKVKHIDIRHHYLRELVKSDLIIFEQIPSSNNIVDIFTKPLAQDYHHRFLEALNIFWGSYVYGGVLKGNHNPLSLSITYHMPITCLSSCDTPFMDIMFLFLWYLVILFPLSDYFIYYKMIPNHSQLFSTNWEWVLIPILSLLLLIYYCSLSVNRLELQIQLFSTNWDLSVNMVECCFCHKFKEDCLCIVFVVILIVIIIIQKMRSKWVR